MKKPLQSMLIGAASFALHHISKVLVELFHRAVRGSILLKHSGHALRSRMHNTPPERQY